MTICVYGAASERIDKKYIDDCLDFGEKLARRGHDLIFGAGGEGLMGAMARGFKKGGGKITGVIPQFFEDNGYEGTYKFADKIIKTDSMAERKRTMEDGCDAFLIVAGGIGTFEELFEALTLKQLGRHKKPIVIYNFGGFYDWFNTMMASIAEKKFLHEEALKMFTVLSDKEEIIRYIENYSTANVNWNILKK